MLSLLLRFSKVRMNMMWLVGRVIVSRVMCGRTMLLIILGVVSRGRFLMCLVRLRRRLMRLIRLILSPLMIRRRNLIGRSLMLMRLVRWLRCGIVLRLLLF